MQIQSWEDVADWSSPETIRLSSLTSCLEAIRLALLERAKLFSIDDSTIRSEINSLESVYSVIQKFIPILDTLAPCFPQLDDEHIINQVNFITPRSGTLTYSGVDIHSFYAENISTVEESELINKLSFRDGVMNVNAQGIMPYKRSVGLYPCRVEFKKWTPRNFYSVYGTIEGNRINSIVNALYKFYSYLCLLNIPHNDIRLEYDNLHNKTFFFRNVVHYIDFQGIFFTTPNGVQFCNSSYGTMNYEDAWNLCGWYEFESDTNFEGVFSTYRQGTLRDSYEIMRYGCTAYLKNKSSTCFTSIPMYMKHESYLVNEYPEELNYNPELAPENTWWTIVEQNLAPNEIKGPWQQGYISDQLPPKNSSYAFSKHRSTMSVVIDLLDTNILKFIK